MSEEKKELTAEEKEEHELDTEFEYYWDRNGNIRYLKQDKDKGIISNQMVRRLDMTSEKAKEITEDDYRNGLKEMQKITDNFIDQIGKISQNKEKEIMEI